MAVVVAMLAKTVLAAVSALAMAEVLFVCFCLFFPRFFVDFVASKLALALLSSLEIAS